MRHERFRWVAPHFQTFPAAVRQRHRSRRNDLAGGAGGLSSSRLGRGTFLDLRILVSGPLHAMSLEPGILDRPFGPESVWNSRAAVSGWSGPFTREQDFSTVGIDGKSGALTIDH